MASLKVTLAVMLIGMAVFGGAIFGIGYAQSWWLRGPGVAIENARTDVIRETNQYVTSQQARLNDLLANYHLANSDDQRRAIVYQMHDTADTIQGRVPQQVATFLAAHPRGAK